jgi:hypothetical protein
MYHYMTLAVVALMLLASHWLIPGVQQVLLRKLKGNRIVESFDFFAGCIKRVS